MNKKRAILGIRFVPERETDPLGIPVEESPDKATFDDGYKDGRTSSVTEAIENTNRALDKWQNILNELSEKHKDWKTKESPKEIKGIVKELDPESDGEVSYDLFDRLQRRKYSKWGIDPVALSASTTGDADSDSTYIKSLLVSEQILADRKGHMK